MIDSLVSGSGLLAKDDDKMDEQLADISVTMKLREKDWKKGLLDTNGDARVRQS